MYRNIISLIHLDIQTLRILSIHLLTMPQQQPRSTKNRMRLPQQHSTQREVCSGRVRKARSRDILTMLPSLYSCTSGQPASRRSSGPGLASSRLQVSQADRQHAGVQDLELADNSMDSRD